MFRTTFCASVVLAVGLLLLAGPAWATIYTFDSDPGWIEVNNRPEDGINEDFGWSETNYAGGDATGEIGGVFVRTGGSTPAYYGVDVGEIGLDQAFELNWNSTEAAKMYYGEYNDGTNGQALWLGFFNRTTGTLAPHPTRPFMGVQFADNTMYSAMYFTDAGQSETQFASGLTSGQYTFRMIYDPTAGSYGALKVNFNGSESTFNLTEAQRNSPTSFDTFGFVAVGAATDNGMYMDAYLDDLNLVVPEPSTLALLICGLAGLLAYGWRRRK